MQEKTISGFSKLPKAGKVRWVVENFFGDTEEAARELMSFWHEDEEQQRILDGFSENTISNYHLPYGVAPNFMINGKLYTVPMVIEESSVVAAASSAAKFWLSRGGFHAQALSTRKLGQVHFSWKGDSARLFLHFDELEKRLREDASHITANMEKRGGGVLDIELLDMTHLEPHYYQLKVSFETCDSMGANFINSVLEEFGSTLEIFVQEHPAFVGEEQQLEVIMAILSNYTPECIVRAWVECPVEALGSGCDGMSPEDFADKFSKAVRIAHIDPHRATTHNKGIFNGVDAVVLATANDFRAVEACGHTYAARDGQYRSLSSCTVEDGIFRFWLDLPLALGTIGGLTRLHPMARRSLELLGNPGAEELMMVIAATGLAQNFAALRSLVTTGIQKGHMKMHLMNILNHLEAKEGEVKEAVDHFKDKVVSFTAVREFLKLFREKKGSNV
ncbi:MAG: hydroxymethylglutaryl-CoA reductase [Phaeodactylibacter sp.]|nr:hydroxymethylglutaryl-CoA reductase [Phaeodactylibacter sp.]MCB9048246.1 hydroxymethylglutaryl-CoA reductase [Lewinellaceae bacterium]